MKQTIRVTSSAKGDVARVFDLPRQATEAKFMFDDYHRLGMIASATFSTGKEMVTEWPENATEVLFVPQISGG